MKLERTKNAKKGILWGGIEKILTIFFTFVLRTVMIDTLGSEYLGLSSLFTSILQILNLSELGFSSAIIYALYKPIAEENTRQIGAILNFYKKVYRCIGIVIFSIGLALLPFLPNLISGEIPEDINIYILYLIYLISSVISYLLFAYKNSILQAYQKNNIISIVNIIVHCILYILQIVGLYLFKCYYWYVILLPFSNVAINILTAIMADKLYPDIEIRGKIDKKTLESIIEKIKGLFVSKLCTATRNTMDSIFVSAFLGLTTLAIYDNYYRIIYSIFTLLNIIMNSIRAGIGNSMITESKEKNYNDFHKFIFYYSWISGWVLNCLVCLFQPFMYIWMGDNLMLENIYIVILGIYFYSLTLGDIRTVYFDAAGLWWKGIRYSILESIVNLVLNWILVLYLGLAGVLLSTILSILIVNFGMSSHLIYRYYFTDYSVMDFFKWHIKYGLVVIGVCIITFAICQKIFPTYSNIGFLGRGIICIIIPNISFTIIYSLFYEKCYVKDVIKFLKSQKFF